MKARNHYLLIVFHSCRPHTILNQGFDCYTLRPAHNDMRAMVRRLKLSKERPSFHLLDVGETRYPYALRMEGRPPFRSA